MTKHAATRLIMTLLGIAALAGLVYLLREMTRLRRHNELLISAGEVYLEAARRNGTGH